MKQKIKYKAVNKGVYQLSSGNYRVRKIIQGTRIDKVFTNKAKAIKFYKSL